MKIRFLREKLRVEIKNETRVVLESLNFEIEMRVSQKSGTDGSKNCAQFYLGSPRFLKGCEYGICNPKGSVEYTLLTFQNCEQLLMAEARVMVIIVRVASKKLYAVDRYRLTLR